ncbi:MAG: GDP-mannose 4,6-dehydratase [Candidatus Collierbacteria bacterium GW2011_GWC2_43_12]|uniref:GDP-mannose 4,6-dehydratase n=1 Tax=Candidatus Collierbacteria bacterium GW2011_GWC2_43_12 TaxID=1618390 RepID=A0A0G1DAP4_9BACT|nr:MAG: GDP-mannose 4,6-dehydratase [Candidatus Collierbacteria bacterium GW2011_GWC2_43_12]
MEKQKTAVIVGVSSQDGSYLAELLLEKGYKVVGTIRRSTAMVHENIEHLKGKIILEAADLIDQESLNRVMIKYQPDEVYNIAAQSVPGDAWSHPFYTGEVTALGPVRVFEAVRHFAPHAKVYQATSREILGGVKGVDRANESTPLFANNPYGIAKAYAHMMINCYRESYGMFVCGGILFNHESPRRSLHFVTRKISMGVACIKLGIQNPPVNELGEPMVDAQGRIHLGDLNAMRDWGYSKDYVEAMWLMLQQEKPKDYVIGTDTNYSIKDACKAAFDHVGMNWEDHVMSNERLLRPTEITDMRGDYSLAKKELGWEPKVFMKELMEIMVDADIEWLKSHNVK